MCGIIGVTGRPDALQLLLQGLERLEYRGYDSAGVVLAEGQGLWRVRAAGGTQSVAQLRKLTEGAPPAAAGIGHTRWATHGRPSEANAHPHVDCSGQLALVHNGIVENVDELRREVLAAGHELRSETDSELVAHLLEDALAGPAAGDLPAAVRQVLAQLRGTLALVVVHAATPELLVAARRVSPLVLGRARSGAALVASDVPALLGEAEETWVLDDDQLAVLRPGACEVQDARSGRPVAPRRLEVAWTLEEAQKGGYPDFMSKEIAQQPEALADTLVGRLHPVEGIGLDEVRIPEEELRRVDKVAVVACGSSYHAGLVAKLAIEHWARLPVEVEVASEFRYRDPVLDERTLVVGISQSGESVDTLQAVRHGRDNGARALVVCNVVDSSLAREADGVLYTRAGPEVCVAATKTHVAQLAALELLALHLAQLRGTLAPKRAGQLFEALAALPDLVAQAVERGPAVAAVAETLLGARDVFYLGRHVGYPVAMEGALKLKELAYVRAEAYPAGELKHGPIALVEPGTVVVAVATRQPLWEKLMANLAEVRARGARVVALASDGDERTAEHADEVLWVPPTEPLFSPLVDVVPLQQLAYEVARRSGRDVDRPRNLAKTVTVE
ncbi:glutamine--fructose-6-phosphate transaminase (isomerizing) [Aciditerrimonas ferrireducens]|uniref:glutamine--fructose-6-phosphate transaminase (isomerizing) n=1 Tax=Aciditerrimonas ferrireducens TaxID=667306 RepID=UPI002003B71B|nr:glutamine--fructose-6-phosphate transaminase (isomerizing) [Aciditerrimonas ferrireducens]MCK4176139.1 glutamine--fructose-6-phosphate transaminase (isomerizing) [Aciditerrimonas ferrireducens]